MACSLFHEGSAASRRYHVLAHSSHTVRLDAVFSGSVLASSAELGLVLLPACTVAEFATDIGISHPQHLGEVVRGKGSRRSCGGWTGGVLNSKLMATRTKRKRTGTTESRAAKKLAVGSYYVAPLHADQLWASGFLSSSLANLLLGCNSAAATRFVALGGLLNAVRIDTLFADARVELGGEGEGVVLFPGCTSAEFARDVGIRSALHLSEVVRGVGGRRSCHGWRGGVSSEVTGSSSSFESSGAFEVGDELVADLIEFLGTDESGQYDVSEEVTSEFEGLIEHEIGLDVLLNCWNSISV